MKIYSNCKVTLYVNGVETSTKVSDEKVFIFEDIALKDGIKIKQLPSMKVLN